MAEPLFTVVRGTPTEEELAAVVAALGVLRARAATAEAAAATTAPHASRWAASTRPARSPRPSPDSWRASALPR